MNREEFFWSFWEIPYEKSIKMRPSRLEQIDLPSVFYTEEGNFLGACKVDATMADHLLSRGHARPRMMQDHHLMQLGGVFLQKCGVFLAT
jgi:hypothetical protein